MANWCNNSFAVYGDKEQLRRLYKILDDQCDTAKGFENEVNFNREEAEFNGQTFDEADYRKVHAPTDGHARNDPWICYAFNSLYSFAEQEELTKTMNLRGYITGLDDGIDSCDPHILIYSDSAWGPWDEFFRKILDDNFPDLDFVMTCEEPGCELYVNTDTTGRYFTDRYIAYSNEDGSEYFSDEKDLKEYLEKIMNVPLTDKDYSDLESVVEKYNEFLEAIDEEDRTISIHEFANC